MKDEFEFIKSITPRQTDQPSLVKGIGDDAAVYRGSEQYDEVVCVDTMVEGIHFRRDTLTPFQIGKKALAINVSDVAAMGAQPIYYIVSVAASSDWKQEELEDVYKGMLELAQVYKMDLIGGDTVSTPDTLVLTVTVIGRVERNRAVYRHMAKPGDVVFITGHAGRSAAGLDLLFEKGVNGSFSLAEQKLVRAHQEPQPHVKAGRILCHAGLRVSLNDVSDGVASEANELAEASNVKIHIDKSCIPIDEAMSSYSREQQLEYMFFGGEDFVLIGTTKEEDFNKVEELFKEEGLFITKIGHVLTGKGVYLKEENQLTKLEKKGYNHFQKRG
ncbi:thiamine-phosphate kinase [Halalkalibacter sp. APA_J-10(15)]|uniref:thiamine-phosphate kinase n=1 Tax=Halalkalibacter sp. APA_J-10(15) TaxID=2933805 RepID=UPI001FF6FA64|nr:thiamine-phosphate kinase [Halalkalibacter sp. APA_J-10(15)]MCK0473425.1 thiamine-phosphate kinase [Halalkalibacter sp. APA_J-10(15)]